jgi:hypothetical protein
MKSGYLILPFIILLLLSCGDNRSTNLPSTELYGSLSLNATDSFHLIDSTAFLAANVGYQITSNNGFQEQGAIEIPVDSRVGDTNKVVLDRVAAGALTIRYSVSRPFLIIGRKDDTSRARFSDSTSVDLLANGAIDLPPIDIWAYRLNQLVLYFDQNITAPQADSIIANLGARKLSQRRSYFDGALIYDISTQGLGAESNLKPIYETIPGIRSVYFSIIGHSYF